MLDTLCIVFLCRDAKLAQGIRNQVRHAESIWRIFGTKLATRHGRPYDRPQIQLHSKFIAKHIPPACSYADVKVLPPIDVDAQQQQQKQKQNSTEDPQQVHTQEQVRVASALSQE